MAEITTEEREQLNEFYIKTLMFSERIRKNVPEKKNLYMDAFFGLMRNGYPYEVDERFPKKNEEPEEDGKKGKKSKKEKLSNLFNSDPAFGAEPVRTVIIKIDDTYYKCPEVDLQYAFGSLYDKVTAAKKKKKVKHENDGFFLPDVYSAAYIGNKKDLPEKAETAAVAVQEDKAKIPYIAFDNNYPSDIEDVKEYDTFCFNYHETHIQYIDGTEKTYHTYVFPLSPDMSDCLATDIAAIMIDPDGNIRPEVSSPEDNKPKSVNEVFKDITFVVRGHWEDGNFISSVALLSTKNGTQPLVTDSMRPVPPSRRTSSFYLRHIEDNGNVLNVFPLGIIRNDAHTGLAPCVMMLEDGQTREMFLSGDNNPIKLTLNKRTVLASAYWAGNSMNLNIDVVR